MFGVRSTVTITRYENRDRRPTVDMLPEYPAALECSIEELIGALPERRGRECQ
ncbi:MAG: helix-turn-helix transcriptional regulator [Clostridia bacterium]|nr:helix-turn-helix transcriptional regulator [Clostridia bacterium]